MEFKNGVHNGVQNGVQHGVQKWAPKMGSKNEVQKWSPKMRSKMASKNGIQNGVQKWGPQWGPTWGPKWSPTWGPKWGPRTAGPRGGWTGDPRFSSPPERGGMENRGSPPRALEEPAVLQPTPFRLDGSAPRVAPGGVGRGGGGGGRPKPVVKGEEGRAPGLGPRARPRTGRTSNPATSRM